MEEVKIKKLIVTSPSVDISSIKSMLADEAPKSWVYFGSNYLTLSSLEHKLKEVATYIDIVEPHKKAADSIRAEYVAWVDELNKRYGNGIDWWVGSVFSRNNYTSDLFQWACYMEILQRLSSENNIFPDIIFVESSGFASDICNWAVKNGIEASVRRMPFVLASGDFIKPLIDWFKFVTVSSLRCIAAFMSGTQYKKKSTLLSDYVIIHTFIHDSSLATDGSFEDRYMPFLQSHASYKGLKVLIHPFLHGFRLSYFSIYKRMRRSDTRFIIREDFLRLPDYLEALMHPLRSLKKKLDIKDFRTFSLSNSVKELRHQECFFPAMNAILTYKLFFRLKRMALKPSALILWYENQVIDKALIASVKRYFPMTKVIGAQLLLHPPNYLSLYPSQSEVDANITPHFIIATSAYQCSRVRTFTGDIQCKVGAALRYSHVFEEAHGPHSFKYDKKSILVALPFYIPGAIEILSLLKNSIDYLSHDVRMLIKNHPDYSKELIKKLFGESNWPSSFHFFNGSMADGIKESCVMVSANSSSMVEAISYGIPSIYAGSRIMINQNILKDIVTEISCECYTPKELAQKINGYIEAMPSKAEEFRKIGVKIRDLYFTPVSEDTMAPFFDLTTKS